MTVDRPRHILALMLLSVAAMAGPLGCGDDGEEEGGSEGGAVATADDGCTTDLPKRVGATDPGYDGWLVLCMTDDGSRVQVENTSGNSFFVWAVDDATYLDMTAEPSTETFAGYLATSAFPPGDGDGNGYWALPPESTLLATSVSGAARINFQVDAGATAAYNAAHSSGAYVDRLAVPRSRALVDKGLACANNAAEAAEQQPRLDLALDALAVRASCQGFLDDALQREGQAVDDTSSAWRKVLANAKRLAGGSWDDELAYGIGRLLRR